ncbi:hypothetical protein P280DRAFT_436913 [Massarina eburnea CBS 473.64]|uniref:Uncharacterized protein n=1 Tax=Massarina eburnea CBS 473.64 TaxID=1395130 RepID=A0A6A6RKF7_9PLEO|nr:hypothetical protein P280DRAFT_436913 [Massarina eburnea CBS 473.64]
MASHLFYDNGMSQRAARELASILWEHPYMNSLYKEAVTILDSSLFREKHVTLLETFLVQLQPKNPNDRPRLIARVLRRRKQCQYVTDEIFHLAITTVDTENHQKDRDEIRSGSFQSEIATNKDIESSDQGSLGSKGKQVVRTTSSDSLQQTPVSPRKDAYSPISITFDRKSSAHGGNTNQLSNTPIRKDTRTAGDSGSGDESGEEDNFMDVIELEAIVRSFTQGSPLQQLRVGLCASIHPDQAIQEAISTNEDKILLDVLTNGFDMVAVGEYSWLKELLKADYTKSEITQLLLEEHRNSPFIFCEPQIPPVPWEDFIFHDTEGHAKDCIHVNLKGSSVMAGYVTNHHGNIPKPTHRIHSTDFSTSPLGHTTQEFPSPTHAIPLNISELDDNLTETIQELCGIAGVLPFLRDRAEWNGTVNFVEEDASVEVSYSTGFEGQSDLYKIFDRTRSCMTRFVEAFNRFQRHGYCCNSFTIAIHGDISVPHIIGRPPTIQLHRIDIKRLEEFTRILRVCPRERIRGSGIHDEAFALLRIFGRNKFGPKRPWDLYSVVHLTALAVQFISIGFLMYIQAHMGPLQPFFLDQPLWKIFLRGASDSADPLCSLIVEPAELTCIGEMLQAPVMAFRVHQPQETFHEQNHKHDLETTANDLLDTWGPGNFIVPSHGFHHPRAIRIGGGIIFCVDALRSWYHWSKTAPPEEDWPDEPLYPSSNIRIGGAVVDVNGLCQLDEKNSWTRSNAAFEYLGTQVDHWKEDERQFGFQAGQYVLVQGASTRRKIPGTTLKQKILEHDSAQIFSALNCLWGLQVSFCTGVARRVPLRLLIADLLPVFARNLPPSHHPWDQLNIDHKIIASFQDDTVLDWIFTLPVDISEYVRGLVRNILCTLEPTGIDAKNDHLIVAWPQEHPPFHCVKISCHQKPNSWVRVLEDSIDCATFAYITLTCLQTKTQKCRGPAPLWRNTAPVLETAVIRHNENPSEPLGKLENKKTYFFEKKTDVLQVTVERAGSGEISLYVERSSIPAKYWRRIKRTERYKKSTRIRERVEKMELGAEDVAILTNAES